MPSASPPAVARRNGALPLIETPGAPRSGAANQAACGRGRVTFACGRPPLVGATNTAVILRASATTSRERLEGWKQARSLWPSFETVAGSARDPSG